MGAITLFDIPGPHAFVSCTYPNRNFQPPFRLPVRRLRFVQSSIPPLPHGHNWVDVFSSPLNPEIFAQLAATGVLGPLTGSFGDLPPSIASHARSQPSIHLVDAHDSRQASFASPSYPYQKLDFQDQASLASSPYDGKPKLRRPDAPNVSPQVPPLADAKHNGSLNGKRAMRGGDAGTHSRQDSAGKVSHGLVYFRHLKGLPGSAVSSTYLPPSYSTSSGYTYNPDITAGRSNAGLHPTLWMSPTSTSPSTPSIESYTSFHPVTMSRDSLVAGNGLGPSLPETQPTSAIHGFDDSPKSPGASVRQDASSMFSDILSDNLFGSRHGADGASTFPSPILSGSPDLHSTALSPTDASQCDPDRLAKEDPLATQVWRMYTRTKANLPHAHRMENLTWRMMALALKKKKDDETKQGGEVGELEHTGVQVKKEPGEVVGDTVFATAEDNKEAGAEEERGRRIDKGKAKVSVVGFDGANQDCTEDDE